MPPVLARIYRSLYRIRRVEEEIARVYPTDVIKSPVHLSIGQEAVAVGVADALESQDVCFGTYRSHAYYLAKGGDLRAMLAELYGKRDGCAKGKGGSMHLGDPDRGVIGASAVVASTIPNAVGYAYAVKLRKEGRVVVSFFGDGAVEEGVFWESLNFAALKRLPVLFACENNGYAIHSVLAARQSTLDLLGRVRAFGVPAERVERNDVVRLRERVSAVLPGLRAGEAGPFFLECRTYRWKEHVGPGEDFHLGYRTRAEAEPWISGDPMAALAIGLSENERRALEDDVEAEIREAFRFAEEAPWPPAEELLADLYRAAG